MIPLRPELSTVSMPPRERMPAKRRAKAIKRGQPVDRNIQNAKQSAKAPKLTLAATRQRRPAALNVAYLDRPDGYHIKKVVRRVTPPRAPPIPYLSDQDDIPRSDDKDSDGNSTAPTVPEIAVPIGVSDIGMDVDDKTEEQDYDAEGETDDEFMEDYSSPPAALTHQTPTVTWGNVGLNPKLQMWPNTLAHANDLIGDASEEDLKALFGGLGDFPTGVTTDFPAGGVIPTAHGAGTITQGFQTFSMDQLHAAVDDLQAFSSPRQGHVANHLALPPASVPVDHLLQPLPTRCLPFTTASRAPTPAPALGCPFGIPSPLAFPSPLPRRVDQVATVSCLSTPASIAPRRRAPDMHSSTQGLVAKARATRPPSLALFPPPPIPIAELRPELLRLPPLRRSLDIPDFLRNEDGNSSFDEDRLRSPTPVAFEDTDIGLNEFSPAPTPAPATQARTRAIRYLNFHASGDFLWALEHYRP